MSKSTSSSLDPKEVAVDRIRAAVEDADDSPDPDTVTSAQYQFWSRLRPALAENNESRGLKALDDLALAIMADDPNLPATLAKPAFFVATVQKSRPRRTTISQSLSATSRCYVTVFQASRSSDKPKSSKKPKTSGKSRLKTPLFKFELPTGAPSSVKKDLTCLVKAAAQLGKAPFRVAYPWRGQRVWYDPTEYQDLHLAHYRFWMKHRRNFFDCALYAPTDKAESRRKHKTIANQQRLKFIRDNIEVFGYYEFMRRFEDENHDNVMWLGGKAAKHSARAKNNLDDDPPQEELLAPWNRDRPRYERVIARMSDPQTVDEDGNASIPELLERSNALDPTHTAHLRLSLRALARIVLDIRQGPPANPSWVGNKTRGSWKTLLANKTLKSTQLEVARLLQKNKSAATLAEKPFRIAEMGEDDSDFEEDGEFTALPPEAPLTTKPKRPAVDEDSDVSSHTGLTDESDHETKNIKKEHDSDFEPDDEDDQDSEEGGQKNKKDPKASQDDIQESADKSGGGKDLELSDTDDKKSSPPPQVA